MRWFALITILLFQMGLNAHAEEDPNLLQMKRLYSKISEMLAVGNNPIRPGGTFLVLASPGYLLDPDLKIDTSGLDRISLNSLIEKTMEPDWIYKPHSALTSEIYRKVLKYHQSPDFVLSTDLKKQLDEINKEIYTSSNGINTYKAPWKQFQELRTAYATAIDNKQAWVNGHPGMVVPSSILDELKNAKEAYITLGEGTRRSSALQKKREIEAFDPQTFWSELTGFFDGNVDTVGGREYPINIYYPKYKTWVDSSTTWQKVTLSQQEFEQTTINGSTSAGGGLGGSYGLFSFGGSASGSSDWHKLEQDVSKLAIEFQVLRVNIERPWMDTMVFYSKAWRWGCSAAPDNDKPLISDGGDPSKGQQLTGVMPFLPTGILIAKKLNVSLQVSNYLRDKINSQSSGGGSVSFGPWHLGGHKAESESKEFIRATATNTGVSFDAPQIIGYFVEVLPRTPDPLANLKFQKCQDEAAPALPLNNIDTNSLRLLKQKLDQLQ